MMVTTYFAMAISIFMKLTISVNVINLFPASFTQLLGIFPKDFNSNYANKGIIMPKSIITLATSVNFVNILHT